MNKKLTLSLDDSIILKAKEYADNKKQSLSKMVENYFKFITAGKKKEKKEIAEHVKELTGSIKAPEGFNDDDTRYEYLKDKYLND